MLNVSTGLNMKAGEKFSPLVGQSVPSPKPLTSQEPVEKVSREFLGVFYAEMFRSMWSSMPVNELFGGGYGEKVYRDFLADEYAKMLAQRDDGHLSQSVIDTLTSLKDVKNLKSSTKGVQDE